MIIKSREKLEYLLEMGLLEVVVSLTARNIRYNLHNINIEKSLRQYNISLTGGRDGIVEEIPVYIYYAYLKPT